MITLAEVINEALTGIAKKLGASLNDGEVDIKFRKDGSTKVKLVFVLRPLPLRSVNDAVRRNSPTISDTEF